jgi:hypothetical protein
MFTVVTSEDDGTPVKDRVNSIKGGSMQVDPQQMASFANILELLISGIAFHFLSFVSSFALFRYRLFISLLFLHACLVVAHE